MSLAFEVLKFFSRDPDGEDLNATVNNWDESNSLDLLDEFIPNFREIIDGSTFVDFGCGYGQQTIALAKAGASKVLGIDINTKAIAKAKLRAEEEGLSNRVEFVAELGEEYKDSYDYVISQNSMEHFPDPVAILSSMSELLRPGGKVLMTFGPPWYAPYGSHMHFFTKVPWVNIIFSEKTVMSVRSLYRDDGAMEYEQVDFGLNKMTVAKFERIVAGSGLFTEYREYRAVKGLSNLTKLPLLRELFVNHITAILRKP